MVFPEHIASLASYIPSWYRSDPDTGPSNGTCYLALSSTKDSNLESVDAKAFFAEYPVDGGNDVFHIKPLSCVARDDQGNYPMSSGSHVVYCRSSNIGGRRTYVDILYLKDRSIAVETRQSWNGSHSQYVVYSSIHVARPYPHKPDDKRYIGGLVNQYSLVTVAYYATGYQTVNVTGTDYIPKNYRNGHKECVLGYVYGYIPLSQADDGFSRLRRVHTAVVDYVKRTSLVLRDTYNYWSIPKVIITEQYPPEVDSRAFLLDEYNLLRSGYSSQAFAAYWIKACEHNAYLSALDDVPVMSDNSISNIIEIVSFLKHLLIDHKVDIPSNWQDLWLAYRYTYGTTKSDIEDAINFFNREIDTSFLVDGFSCYGSYSFDYKGTEITCRCSINMKQKELSQLKTIIDGLHRYGLSPDLYILWDLVPYSFIVDWFIPVGDMLKASGNASMYAENYDIYDIWFSFSYEGVYDKIPFKAYTRVRSNTPPEFNGFYYFENKRRSTKYKTLGCRILDVLSLTVK